MPIRAYVVTSANADTLYVCPTCYAKHYHGVDGWEVDASDDLDIPACEECGAEIDGV